MGEEPFYRAVEEHGVPQVDDAVEASEDLKFQERWWKFERAIWVFFLLVLIADALGAFGRGWLAKAQLKDPASGMNVKYERVERAGTPSTMQISLQPEAVQNGQAQLFVSDSLLQDLGAQRIVPQPEKSVVGGGGVTYTFPASGGAAELQIALEPKSPGVHRFRMQVAGRQAVEARVVVMP